MNGSSIWGKTLSSLMAACFSFEITHNGGLDSVCGVTSSLHESDGNTRFTHQRSHTYIRAEGRQAVCARWGGQYCTNMHCLYVLYWSLKDAFREREAKQCASWHSTVKVFPARSWPQPQSEDCLLSPCQHDTVSNRAAAANPEQLHSSQKPPCCSGMTQKIKE